MNLSIVRFGLLVACISVTTSLYWRSADTADQEYANLESQVRELVWLNSNLDSSVLALRLGRETNYDRLSHFERQLTKLTRESLVSFEDEKSIVFSRVKTDQLHQQLREKVRLVNDFKSDHAVVKNALAGFLRNLQNTKSEGIDAALQQRLNELEVDGHRFNLLGTEDSQGKFKAQIASLSQDATSLLCKTDVHPALNRICRNASKLAELRLRLDLTVDQLIQVPVATTANTMMHEAGRDYAQVLNSRHRYRSLSTGSMGVLFAFCFSQCILLRRRSKQLYDAKEKLEERVKERTQQLFEACDEMAQLNEENEKLAMVVKYTDNSVIITDSDGVIEWVNDGFERCTGYSLQEAVGKRPGRLLQGEETDPKTVEHMQEQLAKKSGFNVEVLNYTKNGKPFWVAIEVRPIHDKQGEVIKFIAIESDVTERVNGERERERLSAELQTAARCAGMAEVATGVLHNVGNVLNSVNVSSSLMMEKLKTSSTSTLSKATEVIKSKEDALGEFLTNDNRGRNFPKLLEKVAVRLKEENESQVEELENLIKNINHIKEIVAMQQNFARQGGTNETINPVEMMDDALGIISSSFARHQISVSKNYQVVEPIVTKKHELLQILINLIKNAKQAVTKSGKPVQEVELRVSSDERFVRFEVSDNGIGISKQNAQRIFQHGFTTKDTGHGFGLHSCANAAQEMGGSLTFSSNGEGEGATFQLKLPHQLETSDA